MALQLWQVPLCLISIWAARAEVRPRRWGSPADADHGFSLVSAAGRLEENWVPCPVDLADPEDVSPAFRRQVGTERTLCSGWRNAYSPRWSSHLPLAEIVM